MECMTVMTEDQLTLFLFGQLVFLVGISMMVLGARRK